MQKKPEQRGQRLKELKEILLDKKYPEDIIDRAVQKASKIPRKVALLKVKAKLQEKGQYLPLNLTLECLQCNQCSQNIGDQ